MMELHPSDRPPDGETDVVYSRCNGSEAEDTSCAVCGVPIIITPGQLRTKKYKRYEWWDPCAIHAEGYHYEAPERYSSLEAHDLPVEIYGFDDIEIEYVHRGRNSQKRLLNVGLEEYPYIGLHRKCLDMMQRLVSYRKALASQGVAVTDPRSLSQIYEVLEYRITRPGIQRAQGVESSLSSITTRQVIEPHDYYFRVMDVPGNVQWPIGRPDVFEYEVDPFPIPGLTDQILAYLEPLPEHRRGCDEPSTQLLKLPVEIVEEIYLHLHPFVDPGRACTYYLPSDTWRDFLFYRQLLPWLWDLDVAVLRDRSLQPDDGSQPLYDAENYWNWEQLVRMLAQTEIFEPGNDMSKAPLRLRNRRRIWRLLDEARLRDVDDWLDNTQVEQ
ncbi:uncharacterized protein GIQ15_06228 [Arthroderma uncinatum]|uniref:uncharacterized protein n=1 Tax=Arthroderma uncinatum TaxID=74035 RepID=UPI00144A9143|nr:uncharacterized protein GIQ15_06228 [Arthroderma uncinatum]KAF3480881.1 hypothetical protein GIQ15_06228 [Arthroderma uncinatum]